MVISILLLNVLFQENQAIIIIITAILALTFSIIFHNINAIRTIENWHPQRRWFVTGLSYFFIIFALILLSWYVKFLVYDPGISLSLSAFYSLDSIAILTLFSIAFLLVALYLFSHRLMTNIVMAGLSKYARLGAVGVAMALSIPILIAFDLEFQLMVMLLAIFIYIILFDLFIDNQIPGITWFITWIVLFSVYLAILLGRYQYTQGASFQQMSSLFSCAFLALTLTIIILFSFSRLFSNIRFPIIGKPSLRNRIQILVILLTLLSFAVVGAVTISFFKDTVLNWQKSLYYLVDQLIKIYVFLLLATGVLAIAVANSITRPIVRVGKNLKNLTLGKNEAIEWHSSDEIGELISEYNQMIQKLEESTEKLKQSERESAWREMAKQVAHEIKNPLTPMKLSIQYLQHTVKSNPEEAQAMLQRVTHTMIEQIDGLARIATEFSNFAKMPKPENETFTLNDVVQSVFDLFAKNPENNVELNAHFTETPLQVFADKDHIIRVLNNLIKNAIQAIPEDRQGRIEVSLFADGDRAVMQVQDNGSGIAPDMQERVFQPNFTTKSSGTGLGLAMSKNIVEAAGGSIWLHSEVGKGTSFFVALPISYPS